MNGASAALMVSNIPFPTPGRRRADRQGRRQLRRQPDGGAAAHGRPRPRGRGHRRGHPDGRGGRQRDHRGRDARRARHRPRRDQEALRRAARARRQGRQAEARGHRAAGRRGPLPPDPGVARRAARPATQVEDKLERQDATKAVEEEVLAQYSGDPAAETYAEYRQRGAARVRQAREEHHPRAHRGPQEAPGRPLAETRSGRSTSEVGLLPRTHGSALFTRGQTQALSVVALGTTREEMRLDNLGLETSKRYFHHYNFPPFSVGRGRLHARPQAPRHRPRRARRARAGADDPVAGGVPLHDPRRVGHPRVQRLVVDGLGVRLLAVADGRRRAAQGAGGGRRDGPDQGGRRLHGPDRHRRRRGPPRRHGLQGRRHRERHHRAPDGHQDHRRHVRDPARRAHAGARGPAVHPRQDGRGDRRAAQRAVRVRAAHLGDPDRPGQDRPADRQGRRDDPRPVGGVRGADRRRRRGQRPRLRADRRPGRRPDRPDPLDDQGGRGRRRVRRREGRQDDHVRRLRRARQGHRRPAAHLQRLARPAGRRRSRRCSTRATRSRSAWSRSTRSAAASACASPRTRTSPARPRRSSPPSAPAAAAAAAARPRRPRAAARRDGGRGRDRDRDRRPRGDRDPDRG